MPSAPASELDRRPESTHDTDYAEQYHMPLRSMFQGNNRRTDRGVN